MTGDNELTGPIPTQIGLLAALEYLNLGKKNVFCFTIMLWNESYSNDASDFSL